MAAEPFTTTRRTLLGAAAALPIAALNGDSYFFPAPTTETDPALAEKSNCPPSCLHAAHETWNRRLAEYRRLAAAKEAEETTGAFRAASDLYDVERAAIVARFGSWHAARETEQGRALCRAAFTPMSAAEEAFYDDFTAPLQRAAVRLALTPPPDLPALLAKIRVMQDQELDELEGMTRPVLEVLADDVRRLDRVPRHGRSD